MKEVLNLILHGAHALGDGKDIVQAIEAILSKQEELGKGISQIVADVVDLLSLGIVVIPGVDMPSLEQAFQTALSKLPDVEDVVSDGKKLVQDLQSGQPFSDVLSKDFPIFLEHLVTVLRDLGEVAGVEIDGVVQAAEALKSGLIPVPGVAP